MLNDTFKDIFLTYRKEILIASMFQSCLKESMNINIVSGLK